MGMLFFHSPVQASFEKNATYTPEIKSYIRNIQQKITNHWNPTTYNATNKTVIEFKILSSTGEIYAPKVLISSGSDKADNEALNIIHQLAPFQPAPASYKNKAVKISATFDNVSKSIVTWDEFRQNLFTLPLTHKLYIIFTFAILYLFTYIMLSVAKKAKYSFASIKQTILGVLLILALNFIVFHKTPISTILDFDKVTKQYSITQNLIFKTEGTIYNNSLVSVDAKKGRKSIDLFMSYNNRHYGYDASDKIIGKLVLKYYDFITNPTTQTLHHEHYPNYYIDYLMFLLLIFIFYKITKNQEAQKVHILLISFSQITYYSLYQNYANFIENRSTLYITYVLSYILLLFYMLKEPKERKIKLSKKIIK